MEYIFENDRPIYLQLVEQFRIEIVSGKYRQGDRLPSVRELAMQARVNPNTIQKALAELEREQLIFTERTNGKYVTNDSVLINECREKIAKKRIEDFLECMNVLEIGRDDIIRYLQTL